VRELLGRRLLERGERDALRIDRSDHVADDAALARGVHRLQHQQHRRSALFDTALRVEALLQLIELVRARLEVALPLVFVAVVARGGCRIEVGETEPGPARRRSAGSAFQFFWLFAVIPTSWRGQADRARTFSERGRLR
jgi:hypothetical protein